MRHGPKFLSGAALALLSSLASLAHAQSNPLPTLAVNGSSGAIVVPRGSVLTVNVENGPGNPGDWLAVYPTTPANATYITWKYLDNQQTNTPPSQGRRTATVTFNLPFAPGEFEVRLLPYTGTGTFAVSPRVTVSDKDLPIALNGAFSELEVKPRQVVNVTVHGPGNALDWLGLHPLQGTDQQHPLWLYLNGSTTPPSAGVTQATVPFQMPNEPGVYNIRFFLNDKYTRIARSAPIFVIAPDPAGTISGADQPDAIPDLLGYQRLFASLRWRRELNTGDLTEDLRDAGLTSVQAARVVVALDSYIQGAAVASLMVGLRTDLGDEGWNKLQAYTQSQVKAAIKIIPGGNQ